MKHFSVITLLAAMAAALALDSTSAASFRGLAAMHDGSHDGLDEDVYHGTRDRSIYENGERGAPQTPVQGVPPPAPASTPATKKNTPAFPPISDTAAAAKDISSFSNSAIQRDPHSFGFDSLTPAPVVPAPAPAPVAVEKKEQSTTAARETVDDAKPNNKAPAPAPAPAPASAPAPAPVPASQSFKQRAEDVSAPSDAN